MLKLVRAALTAAVLAALAVRLRRRARLLGPGPAEAGAGPGAAPAGPAARRPTRFGMRRPRRVVPLVLGASAVVVAALTLSAYMVMPDRFGRVRQMEVAAPAATRATAQAERAPGTGPATPAAEPAARETPGCRPAARPVVVRPLDPKVRRAVDRQWRRIERWLEARAPRTYAALEGPGRAGTIAVAESQMGVGFPDDLRASLLRHDGSAAFGFGHPAHLGVREIRDAWRALCRGGGPRGDGVAGGTWHGGLIPVQRRADGGWSVLRARTGDAGHRTGTPGAGGRPEAQRAGRGAYAWYALVRATADALERGGQVQGREPRVVRGSLRWTPARPARTP
ncbi:SMI1/KNR4 family protein [Nonomuraea indica]|uniref:SMI1/KNR4 family protein n=1 Tax=Nonomuraea indica TaxID=1581193 RepID=A0ABW8A776_9ACTN